MKSIQLLILVMLVHPVLAQDTFYFTSFFQRRSDMVTDNKREYQLNQPGEYTIKDYFKNVLQMEGIFKGFASIDELDQFLWYFKNNEFGDKDINTANKTGELINYKDGGKINKLTYENGEIYYCQIWKNGLPILKEGTGQLKTYNSSLHQTNYRIFQDSLLIKNFSIRDVSLDTIYYLFDRRALLKNGLRGFIKDVRKSVKLPNKMRQLKGRQRILYIKFIVNEDGSLSDFKLLTKQRFPYQKKIIKALKKLPDWNPALFEGRTVKQVYMLPITLKPD